MNNRKAILFSLALALPCAQLMAMPKASEAIIRDAARSLHRSVQDNRGATRAGLKSVQAVALAHTKKAIKDLKPQEAKGYIDSICAWAASHADLLVDLTKILSGDAIDRGVSKKGLGTRDAVAEAFAPALAKLADKHGTAIPLVKLVQGIAGASVKAHFFADKDSKLDSVANGVQVTLGFFENDVITSPLGWQKFINITKGMQALGERAVEYVVGLAMDKALAGKLDKQSHKTLAKILVRLCVEPLNPLVERGINSLHTEQTDEKL